MKKFDFVFEHALNLIKEREFIDTTFEDNVRELAKSIINFLPKKETEEKTIEAAVTQVMHHNEGVKEMFLGNQVTKQIKLHLSQLGDSGTFEVSLVGKDVPENEDKKRKKTISNNQHDENIFKQVNDELIRLTTGSSADAVQEMPLDAQPSQSTPEVSQKSVLPGSNQ